MKTIRLFSIAALATGMLFAQRHKLTINAETPEGQLLQQIGQEADPAKKTALMEDFASKHPKHEGAGWVLEQLTAAHLKANSFDQALAAGEKLIALDPDDVVTSHNCLKAAEGKKDPDLIKKWAANTSKLARKAASAPEPSEADAKENWKANVDYAKQVDTYTEYALYAAVLATQDPAKKIMLFEALQSQNPKSEYIAKTEDPYFLALRQAGQNDKALELAERVLETRQDNEDMLLVVADKYMKGKTPTDKQKTIDYSNKLAQVMGARQKPEGVSDADWTKRKNLMMGMGFWMAGMTYAKDNKSKETDEALRQALPLIQDTVQLAEPALFQLGLANYNMGKATNNKKLLGEALNFNRRCAALKGSLAGQATKNAQVISQTYGLK